MFSKKPLKLQSDFEPRVLIFPKSPNNLTPKSQFARQTFVESVADTAINRPLKKKLDMNPDFTYELINLEMELQSSDDTTQDLITRLFELYKFGVQYYNLRQDKREKYFKKKMEFLTNHPTVLGVLAKQNQDDHFYKKKQLERIIELDTTKAANQVEQIVKKAAEKERKNHEIVQHQLNDQLTSLKRRIEIRKNTVSRAQTSHKDSHQDSDQEQVILNTPPPKNKKPRAVASFGVSIERNENYDDLFVEKFIDI